MSALEFKWHPGKARTNKRRHKVTFQEASTAFLDDRALEFYDPDHSSEEDRFLLLGISRALRVLVISFCYREEETVIRLISARKATPREAQQYWGQERQK